VTQGFALPEFFCIHTSSMVKGPLAAPVSMFQTQAILTGSVLPMWSQGVAYIDFCQGLSIVSIE
jgi:hypothetical protein